MRFEHYGPNLINVLLFLWRILDEQKQSNNIKVRHFIIGIEANFIADQ
jgi:hypothetical protein